MPKKLSNALTPLTVKNAKPGRHADGGGLHVLVKASGARSWVYRFMLNGKSRDVGLGPAAGTEALTLAMARDKAVAQAYIAANEDSWRNPKHRQQWRNTLATYVYPVIGDMPVAEVGTAHVLQILEPIWRAKSETANRVRGRIETVLDAAKAGGYR